MTEPETLDEDLPGAGAEIEHVAEHGRPDLLVAREHLDLIKRTIAPDLNDAELVLFAQVANRVGLDPFARQIYAVKRRSGGRERVTFQTGIDGYRLIARRTGQMAGRRGPYFAGGDGAWKIGPNGEPLPWLETVPPAAALVGVLRHGDIEPTWGIATWAEYAITGDAGAMWAKMPTTMLAKCAEAQAIRACFPAETSGVYTDEEMDQAGGGGPVIGATSTVSIGAAIDPWTARPSDINKALRDRGLPLGGKVDELRQRLADALATETPAPAPQEAPTEPAGDDAPDDADRPADAPGGSEDVVEVTETCSGDDQCEETSRTGSGIYTDTGWYCATHAPAE